MGCLVKARTIKVSGLCNVLQIILIFKYLYFKSSMLDLWKCFRNYNYSDMWIFGIVHGA